MQQDPKQVKEFICGVASYIGRGGTLGALNGYSPAELESLFSIGHEFYVQGRFTNAMQVFAFLMESSHLDRRFYFSMAACLQMTGRYTEAIQHYSLASLLDCNDPYATFHTAECLYAMKMFDEAVEAFDLVVEDCQTKDVDLGKRAAHIANVARRTKLTASPETRQSS